MGSWDLIGLDVMSRCARDKTNFGRDGRRIFGGLKFFISGYFWVGQFWKIFSVYSKLMFPFSFSFNAFWKFLRLGNLAWDFLGVKFWSREFFQF